MHWLDSNSAKRFRRAGPPRQRLTFALPALGSFCGCGSWGAVAIVLWLALGPVYQPISAQGLDSAEYIEAPIDDIDREHWAFQPIQRASPATTSDSPIRRNPIDDFIDIGLKSNQLTLQPPASKETLIRRLSFDLTGLPPTPDEIDAYVTADEAGAYARLVDQLVSSPRFGQHLAQPWLDLARFAETDGFEHDKVRPNAWRYRDWVIQALNDDLAFDNFIRQQIAGDELHPGDEAAKTATRFCLSGPDMPDINLMEERRHTLLNEMVATIGESILGLQVGCAQCHDHPHDAISQADFYRLRAIFEPAVQLQRNKSVTMLRQQRPFSKSSHLMIRGNFHRPGPAVTADVPRVLKNSEQELGQVDREQDPSARTLFAQWLVSQDNPLTARVIVNRVWQHHFGAGLVNTPNEFGVLGAEPSHPELLDWLAASLVESGWSLKHLHRTIVSSATYRQRSFLPLPASEQERTAWKRARAVDSDGALLSRFPRRRLSGESIRDAILAAAGQLNENMDGPGVRPPLPQELVRTLLPNQWNVTEDTNQHTRRSIFLFARRNLRYPFLQVFDRPSANTSCGRRDVTTTAPQSLHLLNSEFTLTMARRMSRSISSEYTDHQSQIVAVFRRALGRRATEAELTIAGRLWDVGNQGPSNTHASTDIQHSAGESTPLTHLCLSLFNSNEFVFVD